LAKGTARVGDYSFSFWEELCEYGPEAGRLGVRLQDERAVKVRHAKMGEDVRVVFNSSNALCASVPQRHLAFLRVKAVSGAAVVAKS